MSSNPSYREPRRDFNLRGGVRGGGRGRGGFSKPSRRYWDNDDYYDRDSKDRDSRRRHSRSRSRSRSRSYSRSRSRSASRSRRRSTDYEPKMLELGQGQPQSSNPEPYEPYIPQPNANKSSPSPNNWKPTGVGEYGPQTNGRGRGGLEPGNLYEGVTVALNPMQMQIQRIQQQVQMQKFQLQQHTMDDPSITFSGYGFGSTANRILPGAIQTSQMLYPQSTTDEPGLVKQVLRNDPSPDTSHSSKKKKDKQRKKKKKRRSSSSSSSSSDDSSGSRRRRKKRGRDSDDSSDSSSENEEEKKEKEKPASTSGLTSQQREALLGQKDSYKKKLEILEREIKKLQAKEDELKKMRADIRLVEENLKLQAELKGRCKAVHIVLEKINDVLQVDQTAVEKVRTPHPVPPPPPKISQSVTVTALEKPVVKEAMSIDFDYFDNGQHWCRLCNVFPENVEQMLNHFHSQAHRDQVEQLGIDDKPWHKRNSASEKNPNPGAKKVPFRGLQFFSPVEGWYCRLCNIWMGDHHCATDHLKCNEHNSNYMNFLVDHSDWESKWGNDREKARARAGLESKTEPRKSRFEDRPPAALISLDETTADENGRSIRVQMRNTIKVDENRSDFVSKTETSAKDSGLDEWMGKPQKIALDIIDTQKFAEIVRQKHGNKIKEEGKVAPTQPPESLRPSPSNLPPKEKDKERDLRREDSGGGERDRRRYDRVELQISSRENRERDRYRESRGGRRRSRSRSRSRDRGHHGRRKSRSRSRDRRDRDRNTRDKIDAVKKLPMIGKMPLYKRPLHSGKDKDKQGDEKDSLAAISSDDMSKMLGGLKSFGQHDESNTSIPSENSLSGFGISHDTPTSRINFEGFSNEMKGYGIEGSNDTANSYTLPESRSTAADTDLKPPGEKEAPGGTNLPDDFQQALDIIYKGGGKPIPIPPPSMSVPLPSISSIPIGVPPPSTTPASYDYSSMPGSGYPSYMGYEPYQMSFDNYVPPPGYDDMEEVISAGNVPLEQIETDAPPGEPEPQVKANGGEKDESENADDDMDDLRMLGIDLDDVAVVRR